MGEEKRRKAAGHSNDEGYGVIRPIFIGQLKGLPVRFYKPSTTEDGLFPGVCGEDLLKAFCLTGIAEKVGRTIISQSPKRFPDLSRRIDTVSGFVIALAWSAQKGLIDALIETKGIEQTDGVIWMGLLRAAAIELYPDMGVMETNGEIAISSQSMARLMGVTHDHVLNVLDEM